MSRSERIHNLLTQAFTPQSLVIADDSDQHAGHAGASEQGQSHYTVEIVASAFVGMSRVDRQRAVMNVLKNEFQNGLHALSIKAHPPQQQ